MWKIKVYMSPTNASFNVVKHMSPKISATFTHQILNQHFYSWYFDLLSSWLLYIWWMVLFVVFFFVNPWLNGRKTSAYRLRLKLAMLPIRVCFTNWCTSVLRIFPTVYVCNPNHLARTFISSNTATIRIIRKTTNVFPYAISFFYFFLFCQCLLFSANCHHHLHLSCLRFLFMLPFCSLWMVFFWL